MLYHAKDLRARHQQLMAEAPEAAELRTREKLLEIECQLAELFEKSNHQA